MARRNDDIDEIEECMKRMEADIANCRAESHAMKISFIAHDLEVGRRSAADLPADVLRDVQSLLDKRAKERRLGKRSRRVVEGSRVAAPPPEEEEGYEYEPPVVPTIIFALPALGAPPLGLPEAAPPADLAPGPGGEPLVGTGCSAHRSIGTARSELGWGPDRRADVPTGGDSRSSAVQCARRRLSRAMKPYVVEHPCAHGLQQESHPSTESELLQLATEGRQARAGKGQGGTPHHAPTLGGRAVTATMLLFIKIPQDQEPGPGGRRWSGGSGEMAPARDWDRDLYCPAAASGLLAGAHLTNGPRVAPGAAARRLRRVPALRRAAVMRRNNGTGPPLRQAGSVRLRERGRGRHCRDRPPPGRRGHARDLRLPDHDMRVHGAGRQPPGRSWPGASGAGGRGLSVFPMASSMTGARYPAAHDGTKDLGTLVLQPRRAAAIRQHRARPTLVAQLPQARPAGSFAGGAESREWNRQQLAMEVECRGLDHDGGLGLIAIGNRLRCVSNWLPVALQKLRHPHADNGHWLMLYGPRVNWLNALWAFVANFFVEKERWRYAALNQETVEAR
ncbi:hypothetical protein HU200_020365 [Digitaria exilis]|uniref:Uncharacterized protein n=1 Tax=Digitaria exilis TaxID=1010633 RepID=A0A835F1P5_9POAL|nr:hypothetical protein HU200_020365 [Digitaria exilis]